MRSALLVLLALAMIAVPTRSFAAGPDGVVPAGARSERNPNVSIEEHIGDTLPLDIPFRNEREEPITLRECIAAKPTILLPMYYRCQINCNIIREKLVETLRKMPQYSVGPDFHVICVSFDPKEHSSLAAANTQRSLDDYARPNAEGGWHSLTGTKDAVQQLMTTVGYKYEFDKTFKEYDHPAGIVIITPEGKIARYFYGLSYDGEHKIPGGTTTLRLSLVEASEGKMGSLSDRLLLTCYSFDHSKGYAFRIKLAIQIGGVITLLAVGTWVGLALFRERRRPVDATASPNGPHASHASHDGSPSGETV
jgi:protein SCO1/2